MAAVSQRPRVLVQGSAVDRSGGAGEATMMSSAPAGDDFLARLVVESEAASAAVESLGVRRPSPVRHRAVATGAAR